MLGININSRAAIDGPLGRTIDRGGHPVLQFESNEAKELAKWIVRLVDDAGERERIAKGLARLRTDLGADI